MKLKVISCRVFEPYTESLKDSRVEYDVTFVPMGLHADPKKMKEVLQGLVNDSQTFDGIVLLFGHCGGGTADITTPKVPVAVMNVPDCVHALWADCATDVYCHSAGYLAGASEVFKTNYEKAGYENHPDYPTLKEKYGADNAEVILRFGDSWKSNYRKCVYIDMGAPKDAEGLVESERIAADFGWNHEVVSGRDDCLRASLLFDTASPFLRMIFPDSNEPSGVC